MTSASASGEADARFWPPAIPNSDTPRLGGASAGTAIHEKDSVYVTMSIGLSFATT